MVEIRGYDIRVINTIRRGSNTSRINKNNINTNIQNRLLLVVLEN